jgi:hypothetical protein
VVGIRGWEDDVRGEETWPKKKESKEAEIVGWSGTFLLSLGVEALSREGGWTSLVEYLAESYVFLGLRSGLIGRLLAGG